jgi:hypothetical protein
MNHPENYFLIQIKNRIITIDIYDKNNLNVPIRKISLPESEIFHGFTETDGLQYFNSRWEYYVITENARTQDTTLFKVVLDWTIEAISTGLEIGSYSIIDQEKKQIGYGMNTEDWWYENWITIYDISKKNHKISSYDARKRSYTKYPTDDMRIIKTYSLKNWVIYFAGDHDGVDGNTQDFFTTCFDTENDIELSQSECNKLFPGTGIWYIYAEQSPYEAEPILLIDKKEIWIFTWIEFTDIIGNYVLWLTRDDWTTSYTFYKLEDVISHNIKIKK